MDVSRLRTGELIAGISAVLLFIVMFLPWFGVSVGGNLDDVAQDLGISVPTVDANFNAWESFDFIDIVLLVTVLVAVGLAVAGAFAQTSAVPTTAGAVTAGLGILSTLLVLYRIIDPPGEASREFWVFVGLVLSAAIAYGGWRSMQEEGTSYRAEPTAAGGGTAGGEPPPSAP